MRGDTLERRFEIAEGEDGECALQQLRRILEDAKMAKQTLYVEVWKKGEESDAVIKPFMGASASLGVQDLHIRHK